jgi:hypothetical protein
LELIDFQSLLWSTWLFIVLSALASTFKTFAELRLENLALRQQLGAVRRSAPKRLRLTNADRAFWVSMKRVWGRWEQVLMIVKPETVLAWHRKGFRLFWAWTCSKPERICERFGTCWDMRRSSTPLFTFTCRRSICMRSPTRSMTFRGALTRRSQEEMNRPCPAEIFCADGKYLR